MHKHCPNGYYYPSPPVALHSMRPVIFVTVDAAIAAGKSTLIRRLQGRLRWPVLVVDEPVDEWQASGLLADMYKALNGPQPNADGMPGMFQVYAFATRLGRLARAMDAAKTMAAEQQCTIVVLSERSVFTDRAVFKAMLTRDGHITDAQERVYNGCFDALVPSVVPAGAPDLCVWLDTDVNTCMARQQQRARPGETFDTAYATKLDEQHRMLFASGITHVGGGAVPVLRLDGAQPFHTDDAALDALVRQLEWAIERCA